MNAMITDIKRMAIHDGPGIRTTVFLKGCSLRCLWCHNPETIRRKPQLAYYQNNCTGCLSCTRVCPTGAQVAEGAIHRFDRTACVDCGKCAQVCPAGALTLFGKTMDAEQLLPLLLEDVPFYESTGGGVTLSGGECLLQADFCAEILEKLKKEGIHTAVDTCGFVPREAFDKVLGFTDLFLYDIKAMDPAVHKACTGQENGLILDNLRYLCSRGKQVEIRIPYVPGHNDGEMEAIRDFLSGLKGITGVKVLAYHNFAGSKYAALDMKNTLPPTLPTEEELEKTRSLFA